jgi:uncharacterized RDD family membrane protein YckC
VEPSGPGTGDFHLYPSLIFWGYYTLFEAFWDGQTPGKLWNGIHVIKDSGRQITLFESMTRNLLRVIDALPSVYLIGIVTILISKQNKRHRQLNDPMLRRGM